MCSSSIISSTNGFRVSSIPKVFITLKFLYAASNIMISNLDCEVGSVLVMVK